ncbi:hypothetical protein XENOCAPTIV_003730 [Xenoophorus captivus]|uniref:Uncharacterized protein n=1 Tax=Xenoophorus captivus TaxID=1517983 RepID=A0ABV0RYK0_9TELE
MDEKPKGDFKKSYDDDQRCEGFNQETERDTEPSNMQRTGGLFSDSEAERRGKDSCVEDTQFTEENLLYTVTNLFSAGTDTTPATLRWGLLLMAKYPQIQGQVQEEMARVIGGHEVRVEDRKNLPYTNAVIHEIQRLANIVPMAIPHKTSRRVCLGESLAKMELLLFFTSLMQRFQFTPPPGVSEDELDLTPAVGFTVPPSPHELCAVCRQ